MFGANKSFGTGSMFGNAASTGTGIFGQSKPTANIFGQPANAASPSTGLFGSQQKPSIFGNTNQQQQQQPQTSSIFGAPAQNNQTSSLFGSGSKSIFGTPSNTGTTNIFGASSNTPSSNLFGSSTGSTTGTGMFGSTVSSVTGTTVKFDPLVGQDTMVRNGSAQNISTKHVCITAMKAYENKSVEELRIEDYIANRKTGTGGTTSSGGLFGPSTTTSGGLFGNTQQQQQQPQKSLFGGTTSNSFGAPTGGSIFSNNQPQNTSGSLFAQKTAGTSFGATPATSTSIFASQPQQQQPQASNLFGGSTSTNLFGASAQQQPAQTSSFSFGGNTAAPSGGGLFGQQAAVNTGGGLFGSNAGAAGGGLFGKPAQSTGFSFGGSTAAGATNAFGQPSTGGLFGSNANKPSGLFGSTGATTGGLFGSQPATGSSLFGPNANQNQQIGQVGFGSNVQPSIQANQVVVPTLGSVADVTQLHTNMKYIQSQLSTVPYGDSPLLKYNVSASPEEKQNPLSAQRQLRFLAAKKCAMENADSENSSFLANSVPKIMADLSPMSQNPPPDDNTEFNYKSKNAPPTLGRGIRTSTPSNTSANVSVFDGTIVNKSMDSSLIASINKDSNSLTSRQRKSNLKRLDMSVVEDVSRSQSMMSNSDADALPPLVTAAQTVAAQNVSTMSPANDPVQAYVQRGNHRQQEPPALDLDSTVDESIAERESYAPPSEELKRSPVQARSPDVEVRGIKVKQVDYYSIPSITEMKKMVTNGKVVIPNGLTIGRASYGSVFWPGRIELDEVTLDEIVVFRHREVTVYPKEEQKPEEGKGLNRPAEVTLERVWYVDKKSKEEVRDVVRLAEIGWREYLERQTLRMGAVFKDFRPETGSWVFRVEHFSKYGLPDSDDIENADPAADTPQTVDVHNQVQRIPISHSEKPKDGELAILLNVPPPVRFCASPVGVKVATKKVGLGGGFLETSEQMTFNSSIEFQDDDGFDNAQVPEKKPKLEVLTALEYETSRLLNVGFPEEKEAPKCVPATRSFTGGVKEKTMIGYQRNELIDLASVHRRSSRVGWSSVGTMVSSEQPTRNSVVLSQVVRSSEVSMETITEMVEANFRLSGTVRREKSVSKLTSSIISYPGNYMDLINAYVEISGRGGYKDHNEIWTLCQALFPVDREEGWEFCRGEDLGDWLRKHVARKPNVHTKGSRVWEELCNGNIEKACRAASEEGQLMLPSSLCAFTISPEDTTKCFREQIDMWERSGVLHTISEPLLKCYLVLAGLTHISWKQNGKTMTVNCLKGLHWTQALGIHVWYLRGWNGVEDAFEAYQADVSAGRAAGHNGELYGELIRLACQPQYSVEAVLDAATSRFPNDFFVMWHLWSVLSYVGYRTMGKDNEQRLHMAYSCQLESICLPRLAVFVLAHIHNDDCRITVIQELLDRIAPFTTDEEFDVIANDCQVPSTVIAAAKSITYKGSEDVGLAFEQAVLAQDFQEAHRLFVEDIAPTAIVTGDSKSLRYACDLIEPLSSSIPGWGAYGQIFCDYNRLHVLDDDETEFQGLLASIEARIRVPEFRNTVQRLSIRTIARDLFEYRRLTLGVKDWTTILGNQQARKVLRNMTQLSTGYLPLTFS